MTDIRCHDCRARVPGYDAVHFGSIEGGYRDLCSRCYNEEVARTGGLDFEHVSFEPADMSDATGARHLFHFLLRHLGDRLSLEAFESDDGERAGYEFQVLGPADIDLFELMRRLVERMRRALERQHLVDTELGLSIADMDVRGRISCDQESNPSMPMLVIDGREVRWDEFGRMLTSFEGWQFAFALRDPSDEV
jgi:hypothetical protein